MCIVEFCVLCFFLCLQLDVCVLIVFGCIWLCLVVFDCVGLCLCFACVLCVVD